MLTIDNLSVQVEDSDLCVLNNLSLKVNNGEVHAIMGPNGAGKSTLAHFLAGRSGYNKLFGSVTFDGDDLLSLEPNERAIKGLFLAFQYPVELQGVSNMLFLRTALNAKLKATGQNEVSAPEFLQLVRAKADALKIPHSILKRGVNVGFSGGEKKRNEVLQMSILDPKICIMDETDSGLDIDALKIVAEGVNALRNSSRGFIIITHYHRLLEYISPDVVHILVAGSIVKSGGPVLAQELESTGYAEYLSTKCPS